MINFVFGLALSGFPADSDSSVLSRSASDPSHEKSMEVMARKASDHEGKSSPVDPKKAGKRDRLIRD